MDEGVFFGAFTLYSAYIIHIWQRDAQRDAQRTGKFMWAYKCASKKLTFNLRLFCLQHSYKCECAPASLNFFLNHFQYVFHSRGRYISEYYNIVPSLYCVNMIFEYSPHSHTYIHIYICNYAVYILIYFMPASKHICKSERKCNATLL